MNLKIYKSGQGYWTRMISGLGMAVLTIVGALWLYDELEVINSQYTLYIQATVAAIVIAIFGLIIFRFVGSRPKSVDFLIATEGEMKKVNWPKRKEIIGSTWIVIVGLFLLVGVILVSDVFFSLISWKLGIMEFIPYFGE